MDTLPKRKILISVDESGASDKVVDWAIDNLYREGGYIRQRVRVST